MKKLPFSLICCSLLVCGHLAFAQSGKAVTAGDGSIKDAADENIRKIANKTARSKTLTGWDILGLLYQISLDDLTADDRSLKVKSSLFGIRKIFHPEDSTLTSDRYRHLAFERHFEPFINFNYEGTFNPLNTTVGFNYSLVNANDITSSHRLNQNSRLFSHIKQLEDGPQMQLNRQILQLMEKKHRHDPNGLQQEAHRRDSISERFVNTGDPSVLSSDTLLQSLFASTPATDLEGRTTNLLSAITELDKRFVELGNQVQRGWNVVFSPRLTYAFNQGNIQGYEFAGKAIKGFKLFRREERTTQLIMRASYKGGDDTIVAKSRTARTQINSDFGFNQVLLTKTIKDEDGNPVEAPAGEFSLTGGYNRILKGLDPDEQKGQPTLTARLGFLIGKNSWIVFPFNYNFAIKKALASVSIKINLGEAPF